MALTTTAIITLELNELTMKLYQCSRYKVEELECIHKTFGTNDSDHESASMPRSLVEELCSILVKFTIVMKEYQVSDHTAYATDAFLSAANHLFVFDQIRMTTHLSFQFLDHSRQHFLYLQSLTQTFSVGAPSFKRNSLVLEFCPDCLILSNFDKGTLCSCERLPLGFQWILSFLPKIEFLSANRFKVISEWIEQTLNPYIQQVLHRGKTKHLIGLGDPLSSLLCQCFRVYQEAISHGKVPFAEVRSLRTAQPICITSSEFELFLNALKEASLDRLSYCLGRSKEMISLLIPCSMIYECVFKTTKSSDLTLPAIRLCDAIMTDTGISRGILSVKKDDFLNLVSYADQVASRYQSDLSHIQYIDSFALQLFDALKRLHGLGKREKLLLQLAIHFHQCGEFISRTNPLIHSSQILLATQIPGITAAEQLLIATLYLWAEDPKKHIIDVPTNLDSSQILTLSKLTNIFCIADALDQSHKQKIDSLKILRKDNLLILSAETTKDLTLEHVSVDQNADFFEEVYGIRPILKLRKEHLPWETLN